MCMCSWPPCSDTFFFVLFSEPNVIEGDILGDTKPGRSRRAATSNTKKLWPRGVIPYVIADHFKSTFIVNSLILEYTTELHILTIINLWPLAKNQKKSYGWYF